MKARSIARLFSFSGCLFASSIAQAVTLPSDQISITAVNYGVSLNYELQNTETNVPIYQVSYFDNKENSFLNVGGSVAGGGSVLVQLDTNQVDEETADVEVKYYFQVLGPSPGNLPSVDVPLYVSGGVVTNVDLPTYVDMRYSPPYGTARGAVSIQDGPYAIADASTSPEAGFDGLMQAPPNIALYVDEQAQVQAGRGGVSFVSIDPTITIDPTFLASNPGYSLQFSPFVTMVSGAPEPSTWLLMFAGVSGIGLMLRRAKRTTGFRFKDASSA